MLPRTELLIDLALEEDAGLGDVTSEAIFPASHQSAARIRAKQNLVVCGVEVAIGVFRRVDSGITIQQQATDGERLEPGDTALSVSGSTLALLVAERTALNFLQRLSGIATQSKQFAEAVVESSQSTRVVDTRKTTPGWRALEKYAVRCGGCFNHRASLGEHVLIKDNHITAAGSLTRAVQLTRNYAPHGAKIEVEADSMEQVKEALAAGADIILLDNMPPAQVTEAVGVINRQALVEVSGNMRLGNFRDYLLPGVDVISVGALTHSVIAADLSMSMVPTSQPATSMPGP